MPESIWSHFQKDYSGVFKHAKPRLDYILKDITARKVKKPKVLNIGIGDGYLESAATSKGIEIYSIDPDKDVVLKMQGKGFVGAHLGKIEAIPFPDNTFDFVVASEVLEHITRAQLPMAITEIARVLKRNGLLIGTVPYKEDLILNFVVCPDCGSRFHRWDHKRAFGIRDITGLLKPVFSDVYAKRKAFVQSRNRKPLEILENLVRLLFAHWGVRISSTQIYFKARVTS